MASVTYHVVVVFDRNEEGELVPGEGVEVPNAGLADGPENGNRPALRTVVEDRHVDDIDKLAARR